MLRIENNLQSKDKMEKKLIEKEEKWESQDRSSRQRRIILNYAMKLNILRAFEGDAYMRMAKIRRRAESLSGQAYELIFAMISYILELNRIPSIKFTTEIEHLMNANKEEYAELGATKYQLTNIVLVKQEEQKEV